jgi:hypothetical protein
MNQRKEQLLAEGARYRESLKRMRKAGKVEASMLPIGKTAVLPLLTTGWKLFQKRDALQAAMPAVEKAGAVLKKKARSAKSSRTTVMVSAAALAATAAAAVYMGLKRKRNSAAATTIVPQLPQ